MAVADATDRRGQFQAGVERASMLVLALIVGLLSMFIAAAYQLPIYKDFFVGWTYARNFLVFGRLVPDGVYVQRREEFPDPGFTRGPAPMQSDVLRIIFGYDHDLGHVAMQVFDEDLELVWKAPADFDTLGMSYQDSVQNAPHAFLPMRDGSFLVTFDLAGALARYDRCGKPMWVRHGHFHHSLSRDDDGSVWTWQDAFDVNGQAQSVVRLDPWTGRTLEKINLADIIRNSPEAARLALGVPDPAKLGKGNDISDIFHPNDVEPLPARFAPAFPGVSRGSLLISVRQLDFVGIVDRASKRLVWWANGPWELQHDPDWQADGTITLFNNNYIRSDRLADDVQSSIIRVRPGPESERSVSMLATPRFFSEVRGRHTILPNGNLAVVSPARGRMFEVNPQGELAIHYNQPAPNGYNGIITDFDVVPSDFFDEAVMRRTCTADGTG